MKATKRYIYPPRPTHDPVPFNSTQIYKTLGWVAQLKFNDRRCLTSYESGTVELFNRHKRKFQDYVAPDWLQADLTHVIEDVLGLDKGGWSYLDGGLLDRKNKWVSNTIVIWDILVRNNDWLLGSTYIDRYNWLLDKAMQAGGQSFYLDVAGNQIDLGIKLGEHVFMPRLLNDYDEAWQFVQQVNDIAGWHNVGEPLLEGIVLKSPSGTLQPGTREANNADWCVRSRVRTGRHDF